MTSGFLTLATVRPDAAGRPVVRARHRVVDLAAYSRFKYGDGLVAVELASALASLAARVPRLLSDPRGFLVAVPGYDVAPPAAASLLAPFLGELGASHPYPSPPRAAVRVRRRRASPSDFAAMSHAQRGLALRATDLEVVDDVRGRTVVVLDDVRVTGTHERAMTDALRSAGAGRIIHLYVLSTGGDDPTIEARINAVAVRTVADMAALARMAGYVPNARVLRALMTASAAEVEDFCASVPESVRRWVEETVRTDTLGAAPANRAGAERVLDVLRGAWAAGA
ncbi:PRTase ComF-like [Paraoerskovia marina]|uniref:PRTase ComF-like n=1 Tax=Paraoerskovia marina TaxID=545619 RepID=A0A1H1NXX2_9CELL|nr:phosphoribosyltransferase family protein [Paraoerskovia marina]SDS03831.1 PRTase ComF-like [Paraoerskovia marina]